MADNNVVSGGDGAMVGMTDAAMREELLMRFHKAYLKARKNKRSTTDEMAFEMNLSENLMNLVDCVVDRVYKPGRGIAFITKKPVIREIFAAPFRDRVVHHFLYDMCAEWWDKRFIYDSYSCRVGKGTMMGIDRMEHHIRVVSQNFTRKTYVVKLDIQGYFMSLSRRRLFQRVMWGLDRQFPERGEMYNVCKYLWHEVIFDDPTEGVRRKGGLEAWDELPKSKSLFCQPKGQGIVIGNLSSQLLSNIYLDQLDRFVTFNLGYKHYGRYVDDFFMVVPEERLEQAKRDIKVIERYLGSLGLVLHPNKRYIQDVRKGVEFLGVVIYPWGKVPSRRFKKQFWAAAHKCAMGEGGEEVITSYLGYLKHVKGKKFAKRVFDEMGWDYRW